MKKLYKVRQRVACWRDVYIEAEDGRIASRLIRDCGPVEAMTPWSPTSADSQLVEQAEVGEVVLSGQCPETAHRLWPMPPTPQRVAARAKAARAAPTEAPRDDTAWPEGTTIRYTQEDGTPAAAFVERAGMHGALWVRGPRGGWKRRGAMTSGGASAWAEHQGYPKLVDGLPTSAAEYADREWSVRVEQA